MGFEFGWLKTRYPFDHAAINRSLLGKLPRLRGSGRAWSFVDLGAGLGANVRHCSTLLSGPQDWVLVENDKALATAAPAELQQWAETQGWGTTKSDDGLAIERPAGTLHIRVVEEDFLCWATEISRFSGAIVSGNAVFDLLTEEQFRELARALRSSKLPLWTTLNYSSMHFYPALNGDDFAIQKYDAHMVRRQKGGTSMGPRCGAVMQTVLKDLGYDVLVEKSNWSVPGSEPEMLEYILRFMESSVPEMLASEDELRDFHTWLEQRRRLLTKTLLVVEHDDLLATP